MKIQLSETEDFYKLNFLIEDHPEGFQLWLGKEICKHTLAGMLRSAADIIESDPPVAAQW